MRMLNLNILRFFFNNCFRPATCAQLPAYESPCSVTHTQLNWTPRKLLLGFG
ncbi:hypothetical protein AAG906_028368 [Vitis piasezkii]